MISGMQEDFSWTRSAADYIDLYTRLLDPQHPDHNTPAEDYFPGHPGTVI